MAVRESFTCNVVQCDTILFCGPFTEGRYVSYARHETISRWLPFPFCSLCRQLLEYEYVCVCMRGHRYVGKMQFLMCAWAVFAA